MLHRDNLHPIWLCTLDIIGQEVCCHHGGCCKPQNWAIMQLPDQWSSLFTGGKCTFYRSLSIAINCHWFFSTESQQLGMLGELSQLSCPRKDPKSPQILAIATGPLAHDDTLNQLGLLQSVDWVKIWLYLTNHNHPSSSRWKTGGWNMLKPPATPASLQHVFTPSAREASKFFLCELWW